MPPCMEEHRDTQGTDKPMRSSWLQLVEHAVFELGVFFFEGFNINVSISLSCREGSMAQELLNGAQVGSFRQEVSCKRMSQRMRS